MIKPELSVGNAARLTPGEWSRLRSLIDEHGCVVMSQETPSDAVATLTNLGGRFGAPVFHKLSDQNGIHPIRYIPGYPEYANANVEDLSLHTDGSFEETPPTFMLIYCEIPADRGGLSRLASGDDLYRHLLADHPDYLQALCRPAAFTITRDDRQAQRSVFTPIGDRLRLAYRAGSDVRLEVAATAQAGFDHVRRWLLDPANSITFRLEAQETLVFDNTRVLHGRTAFSRQSQRKLYGLWCDGADAPQHGIAPAG